DEGAEADAAGSEAVVTQLDAIVPERQAEEAARAESAEHSGEVDDDDDDEDEEEDLVADEARDQDGAGAAVAEPVMMEPAERGAVAEEGATLAAAAGAPGAEETPWYPSNRSNGAFTNLPRGQVHRTDSGELVINGRELQAGKSLSIYHRRRWVQTRARYDNGHWYVVVDSQHVPLVPGMRARLDF
ncbi:MAG TPA: DUF5348 domain-containing protein, partial [Limnochordia bacterium]|nr:DUF5348 domain-containing protein [Limnochordia bacterium]